MGKRVWPLVAAMLCLMPAAGCGLSDIRNFDSVQSVWLGAPEASQTVYFITDRGDPIKGQDYVFGEHWGGVPRCGQAELNVPPTVKIGPHEPGIEAVTLEQIDCKTNLPALTGRLLAPASAKDCNKRVLLFIHGYNNIFRTALLRAGQVAHDLDWQCPVLLFDWTSAGQVDRYAADVERSAYAMPLLAQLLEHLEARGFDVQILAHSMGNRLLLGTLAPVCAARPRRLAGQVMLAAPDVGAETTALKQKGADGAVRDHDDDDFLRLVGLSVLCLDHVTLYASDNDVALMTSETAHGGIPRAGRQPAIGRDYPRIVKQVDVVDASLAPAGSAGHGYYSLSWEAVKDMKQVLDGKPASQRDTLQAVDGGYSLTVSEDRRPSIRFRLYRQLWPH
jgi:esterase/lipase superfamily enzyme